MLMCCVWDGEGVQDDAQHFDLNRWVKVVPRGETVKPGERKIWLEREGLLVSSSELDTFPFRHTSHSSGYVTYWCVSEAQGQVCLTVCLWNLMTVYR